MRDIYQVMPFDNTAVTLRMTGAQLKELIQDNLRDGSTRLQISGITAKFRFSKEGAASDLILERDGKPVTPDAEYTVATNNYLTGGGTGGMVFSKIKGITDTMLQIRDLMIKDIKENTPVKMPADGRFVELK